VAKRVRELARQTCEAFEIKTAQDIVRKDHAHILMSFSPEITLSEIMKRIKGKTSSYLFEELAHLK